MRHILALFLILAAVGFGMTNTVKFPASVYEWTIIDPSLAASVATENNATCYNISGATANITSFSDAGDGAVRATSIKHAFLTGETVTIAGTGGKYDGNYVITRLDGTYFTFTDTYDGTATGTAKIPAANIVYSPLTGQPAMRGIGRAGGNSYFTLIYAANKTLYPNIAYAIQTVGFVAVDGTLDTSLAATAQRPPAMVISNDSASGTNAHRATNTNNGYSSEWRLVSPRRRDYTTAGTVTAWATTAENAGFVTDKVTILRSSDSTANEVFYFGGVATTNKTAKLIINFDSLREGVFNNAVPDMRARRWRGIVYVWQTLHDNTDAKARLQTVYDLGWDIGNHSLNHNTVEPALSGTDATESTFCREILSCKKWLIDQGWVRGSEFYGYPGTTLRLAGNNGADVADKYFEMGRGRGYRSVFYGNTYAASDGYDNQLPMDTMNICHLPAAAGDNDNYANSTAKTTLAQTVLHQGTLNIYIHDVIANADPGEEVTPAWWAGFVADVAAYEAAGTLEVITMTDWYNEIYGVSKYDEPTPSKGPVYGIVYGD